MKYTKEQLLEAYNKLPEKLKKAVLSVDTTEAVREIGTKYALPIDKMGELADQVTEVMLGFADPKNFVYNLKTHLGVDEETARKIGEDVNSKIFIPVRESLRSLNDRGSGEGVQKPDEITREEVLREIEKTEPPAIFKGTVTPEESPFDAKMSPGFHGETKKVFKIPPEESKIKEEEDAEKATPVRDPYREPID